MNETRQVRMTRGTRTGIPASVLPRLLGKPHREGFLQSSLTTASGDHRHISSTTRMVNVRLSLKSLLSAKSAAHFLSV